jgi:hypothetical protein
VAVTQNTWCRTERVAAVRDSGRSPSYLGRQQPRAANASVVPVS